MVVVNSVRLLGFISYENFQVNMEGGSVWISVRWRITRGGALVHRQEKRKCISLNRKDLAGSFQPFSFASVCCNLE